MGYSAADGPVDGLAGEQSVDQAGGEAVAAADTVEDVDFDLRYVNDLVLIESDGSPVIAACGAGGAKGAGDQFEVRIGGGYFSKHFFVGFDGKFGEVFGDAFEFDPEHRGKILFVAEKEIDFTDQGAIDFLSLGFAADGAPEGVAVVEVVGDGSAVSAGGVHGFGGDVGCGGGECGEDSAGVQPVGAFRGAEDIGPVKVAGLDLADGGVAAIAASCGGAEAESAFGEVEAVANGATHAVVGDPAKERGIDAALEDEVFDETAYGVFGECGGDGGPEAKAASKAASYVVFAPTFPDGKVAGGMDASFAGVEAEHDFAEADAVPAAIGFGNLKRFHSDSSIH